MRLVYYKPKAMKKLIILSASLTLVLTYSCKNKNTKNSVSPTYKESSYGTAANPNIGEVTVTGNVTPENPATQNSNVMVGTGWNFDACTSTGNVLTGRLAGTSTEISLTFATAPSNGTYNLTSAVPTGTNCRLIVKDAPGQPRGINWYSKGGQVTVTITGTSVSVSFCDIECYQEKYLFPRVMACGYLICA